MKVPISPLSGKPMRVLYEPEKMKFRGEEYDCIYISFRDDAEGEAYTTTESDTSWYNQVTNQYREKHGIPYQDEDYRPAGALWLKCGQDVCYSGLWSQPVPSIRGR